MVTSQRSSKEWEEGAWWWYVSRSLGILGAYLWLVIHPSLMHSLSGYVWVCALRKKKSQAIFYSRLAVADRPKGKLRTSWARPCEDLLCLSWGSLKGHASHWLSACCEGFQLQAQTVPDRCVLEAERHARQGCVSAFLPCGSSPRIQNGTSFTWLREEGPPLPPQWRWPCPLRLHIPTDAAAGRGYCKGRTCWYDAAAEEPGTPYFLQADTSFFSHISWTVFVLNYTVICGCLLKKKV